MDMHACDMMRRCGRNCSLRAIQELKIDIALREDWDNIYQEFLQNLN